MDEVNFNVLLGVQVQSVERPKNFPVGHYDAIVVSHEHGTSSQKGTPYVRFPIKLIGPKDDVDAELFEDAGGMAALQERKPMTGMSTLNFYLTKDAIYRLREFLEDGLGLASVGRNFDEVIPESTNVPLVVQIAHQAGQREGEFFMRIDDYLKVEVEAEEVE